MEHPDITAWLDGLEEKKELERLEVRAAIAWYETLTPAQRHVFDELAEHYHGLAFLKRRISNERREDGEPEHYEEDEEVTLQIPLTEEKAR